MADIKNVSILNLAFHSWLENTKPCISEIVQGITSEPIIEIKTGETDMAGPDWPALSDDKIYIGGYCEERIVAENIHLNSKEEVRNFHIGLDIFVPANTAIFAPIDGIIHSFKNNAANRDYGPTIVIKHKMENDDYFYTLYGHLSLASLDGLEIGQMIKGGSKFAHLGDKNENGGWPPHLHFQIILDMLEYMGDFPGLCKPSEKEYWTKLCPQPKLLLACR